MEFNLSCKCGLSPNGKSFCPTTFKKQYTKDLAKITETMGAGCHTVDRFDLYKCYYKYILFKQKVVGHSHRELQRREKANDPQIETIREHFKGYQ